ncbi:Glu/Leu/Phe/Val dehydrogenase dimerization domain-containing protein [Streptomyces sp. NPDC048282]|uniref:Glu/Leu/Phe/Val dehydrogenase dimerization domain-containing protein n=1 Tax=Streptomyces sp. NPDC048282 TaxID=3365528 RepID=UPI003722C440
MRRVFRALGPAVGGCRPRRHDTWQDGLADALRLSEAMTFKAAVAGLDFGGGKTVIALGKETELTAELREAALEDLGVLIASLEGSYRTGPGTGTGTGPQDTGPRRPRQRRPGHSCRALGPGLTRR